MNQQDFFSIDLVLENDRARLIPMTIAHFSLLETIAYEPSLWKLGMSNISGPEQLKAYMESAISERGQEVSYPFVIIDKIQNAVAGSTRFGNISFQHKRLEIGWTWLHPNFHGTGLNKACKFLLLQFAFEQLEFNRVEIKTDVLNQQSRKAIQKIGGKQEGIFRKHQVTSEGRVRDSIYFSITNDEWPGLRQTVFKD
ncbi:MAG: GNAT family protein [Ferruginibacter sp.]|nr:GNAT family protein [Ferruginibacter sp.]